MKHMWRKLNYIPVLNVLLITDSLELHKIFYLIFILKKISSKGALVCWEHYVFGLKECIIY